MPGMPITDRQVRRYMEQRRVGATQVVAAAKAGFSERTARRLDGNPVLAAQIVRTSDQINRVVYSIVLPAVPAGPHSLTMDFTIGRQVGCSASGHNEVHLYLNNSSAVLYNETVPLAVRCS